MQEPSCPICGRKMQELLLEENPTGVWKCGKGCRIGGEKVLVRVGHKGEEILNFDERAYNKFDVKEKS